MNCVDTANKVYASGGSDFGAALDGTLKAREEERKVQAARAAAAREVSGMGREDIRVLLDKMGSFYTGS